MPRLPLLSHKDRTTSQQCKCGCRSIARVRFATLFRTVKLTLLMAGRSGPPAAATIRVTSRHHEIQFKSGGCISRNRSHISLGRRRIFGLLSEAHAGARGGHRQGGQHDQGPANDPDPIDVARDRARRHVVVKPDFTVEPSCILNPKRSRQWNFCAPEALPPKLWPKFRPRLRSAGTFPSSHRCKTSADQAVHRAKDWATAAVDRAATQPGGKADIAY